MFSTTTSIKPSIYAEQSPDQGSLSDLDVVQIKPVTTVASQLVKPTPEVYDVESNLMYARLKRETPAYTESTKDPSRLLPSPH
jgi:hypothetical protein